MRMPTGSVVALEFRRKVTTFKEDGDAPGAAGLRLELE